MYKAELPVQNLLEIEKNELTDFKLIRLRNLNRFLYLSVYLLLYIQLAWVLILLLSNSGFVIFPGLPFDRILYVRISSVLLLLFLIKIYGLRHINLTCITFRLDQDFPLLEESASLLLKPLTTRNTLERIQARLLNTILSRLPVSLTLITSFYRQFILAGLLFVVLVILNQSFLSRHSGGELGRINKMSLQPLPSIKSKRLIPELKNLKIWIIEPAYTKRPLVNQTSADVEFIQGAQINWDLATTSFAQHVQLLINGKELVNLIPDKTNRHWHISKRLEARVFTR